MKPIPGFRLSTMKFKGLWNKPISKENFKNIQEQLIYIPLSMQGFYKSLQADGVELKMMGRNIS